MRVRLAAYRPNGSAGVPYEIQFRLIAANPYRQRMENRRPTTYAGGDLVLVLDCGDLERAASFGAPPSATGGSR